MVKKQENGIHTFKLGYITMEEVIFEAEREQWWSYVWKTRAPVKTKILQVWLTIENNHNHC